MDKVIKFKRPDAPPVLSIRETDKGDSCWCLSTNSGNYFLDVLIDHNYADKEGAIEYIIELRNEIGDCFRIVSQEEYEARRDAIMEHEDKSAEEALELMDDWMTDKQARVSTGIDIKRLVQSCLSAWQAMQLIVQPAIMF